MGRLNVIFSFCPSSGGSTQIHKNKHRSITLVYCTYLHWAPVTIPKLIFLVFSAFRLFFFVHVLVTFCCARQLCPVKGTPPPAAPTAGGPCWPLPAHAPSSGTGFLGRKLNWGPEPRLWPLLRPRLTSDPDIHLRDLRLLGSCCCPRHLLVAGRTVPGAAPVPVGAAPVLGCWAGPLTLETHRGSGSRADGLGNSARLKTGR